ncbi:MAG: hypothetical protein ACO1OO_07190 [Flavisolibacter sp.]
MISLVILIVVSLLPFITELITAPQEIFLEEGIKRPRQIFRKRKSWRLTQRGKIFLGIAGLTMFFAYVQFMENEQSTRELRRQLAVRDSINRGELRLRDQQFRIEQSTRDSINNEKLRQRDSISILEQLQRDSIASERVEKGKSETISALAKYSLNYDSGQGRIEKIIRDSTRNQPEPEFDLCIKDGIAMDSIIKGICRLRINFCSRKNTSDGIDVKVFFAAKSRGHLSKISSPSPDNYLIPKGLRLLTGAAFTVGINVPCDSSDIIYLHVVGTYFDLRRQNVFNINSIYSYEIATKRFGIPLGPSYADIQRFFRIIAE